MAYFGKRPFAKRYYPPRYFAGGGAGAGSPYILDAGAASVAVAGQSVTLRLSGYYLAANPAHVVVSGRPVSLIGPYVVTVASTTRRERIPRWLLTFERICQPVHLSDVGGDVAGRYYHPGVVDVSPSETILDLERMVMPLGAATVTISPSSLAAFERLNEIGQAKVTLSSWDGHTVRPVVQADMTDLELGYDGDPTSFRLAEDFEHNPSWPTDQVDEKNFDFAPPDSGEHTVVDSAQYHAYPQVWGDAQDVPAFELLKNGSYKYMICGHDVDDDSLPNGAHRLQDKWDATFLATADSGSYWDFENAQGITRASDLARWLIERQSEYPAWQRDDASLHAMYGQLARFHVGGYVDQEGPLFDLLARRMQREFLFVVWQEGGLLRGSAISPTSWPRKTLVYGLHLLSLVEPVKDVPRYTRFKVRYRYRSTPKTGWYGNKSVGPENNRYLAAAKRRWGLKAFGDPIETARHTSAIDLADVTGQGTAEAIVFSYAKIFHRGQTARYLAQAADGADLLVGANYSLVDPARSYDEKRAIFLGREWLSPELLVLTFRTIEDFDDPLIPQGLFEE